MKVFEAIRKTVVPPGPVLVISLIGLMLLSAHLYYKSVKIQRFLEPAVAITKPSVEFGASIRDLFVEEFGSAEVQGFRLAKDYILIDESMLFSHDKKTRENGEEMLKKLAGVFLRMMDDPRLKARIELILVATRVPLSTDPGLNHKMRVKRYERAETVLNLIYTTEPSLQMKHGTYFTATTIPITADVEPNWIEFRIIPSESLHIEVLEKLQKYVF